MARGGALLPRTTAAPQHHRTGLASRLAGIHAGVDLAAHYVRSRPASAAAMVG